jgi:sorting nexin-29
MKNRKAAGPDGLNSEIFKYGGPVLSHRLLQLINKCWKERSIPEEWGKARVKSLFKKGKRDDCSNYRGISPLNSGYKIYCKIITQRFKTTSETVLLEEQNGLRTGRSCIDNVFIIKQTIEKRREFNLETHMAFFDLEKAFDRVNRKQLWQILNRRSVHYHLTEVIKSLYKIPVDKLTQEGKFLKKYISLKEYDKGVIYHRLLLTFT